MAITKQLIKDVHSLNLKKHRDATNSFVAEGPKVVADLLPLLSCKALYANEEFLQTIQPEVLAKVKTVEVTDQKSLERLSSLCAPRDVLAIFEKPQLEQNMRELTEFASKGLCLALDAVQDPGNVGTIVRIADWFGIEHIFASPTTADVFAPKVVQATMGAIGRIKVHYVDLPSLLTEIDKDVPVYGTFLDGEDFYEQKLSDKGIIVMGNEGKGVSPEVASFISRRLYIPPYPQGRATSESLNVAVATAVICAEFRRRVF